MFVLLQVPSAAAYEAPAFAAKAALSVGADHGFRGAAPSRPERMLRTSSGLFSCSETAKALRGAVTLDSSSRSCCGISAARRKRHDGRRALLKPGCEESGSARSRPVLCHLSYSRRSA